MIRLSTRTLRPRTRRTRATECRLISNAILRVIGSSEPLGIVLHELAHYLEICDRWRLTAELRSLAEGKISYDDISDSNTWDLRVMEECCDIRQYKRPYRYLISMGRRRLYRAEVSAIAIAEVAVPEEKIGDSRRVVGEAFRADLLSWGRKCTSINADVKAAKLTPRVQRLGMRLRRILERWKR